MKMKKILTVAGTRPELIRLSVIIKKLDQLCDQILVFTNQNYENNLSTIFFDELKIRKPDYYFEKAQEQFIGEAMIQMERIIDKEKPDKAIVLGDTYSGLMSIILAKKGVPVYHMEAGNRAYSDKLPEEMNRRIIDAVSTINLPYTENSKKILLDDGYPANRVFKTGNPIKEVLEYYKDDIDKAYPNCVATYGLLPWEGGAISSYVLATAHRAENTNDPASLKNIVSALNRISSEMPVVFSIHPRTKDNLAKNGITLAENVIAVDAMGFFEFVKLEKHATCVISDSGTCPEETTLFRRPCVVVRDSTERRELMECGSFILAGTNPEDIYRAFRTAIRMDTNWIIPEDYSRTNVSDTVIKILLGL